jgi:hypothetical protein
VILSVITERNITGNFRIRHGVLECEVLIVQRGSVLDAYRSYRPARESDCETARLYAIRDRAPIAKAEAA